MDQRQVEVDGQRISYLESPGAGAPPGDPAVIFVHGNSSSARTWLPLLDGRFGQRFRCLALDLPGHGQSAPAANPADYSLPGYAAALAGFAQALGVPGAVLVGWSLGGHIALEAAPALPDAAGLVIFGAPPLGSAAAFAAAFLPNPAMNTGFTAQVSEAEARAYAASFTAPGSALDTSGFVPDILATDGAARTGLLASIGEGRFADEVAIVAGLRVPLAVLQGTGEQLVSLDYLRTLTIPTLWRAGIQQIPGVGHAPHQETPQRFTVLLTDFLSDLRGGR
ncbi:MAG TPA: alpha/beta hydrolase [Trebonia sp.]